MALQLGRNFREHFFVDYFMQMFSYFLAMQNIHNDKWGKYVFQSYHYR